MGDKGKAIWITGANSGIGKSITQVFSENELECIASARREIALKKLYDEFPEQKKKIHIFPMDISDNNDVVKVPKKILKKFDVDCLINNAGITTFTPAESDSFEVIEKIIQTNLIGTIKTIKSILPHFKNRNGGTIINILSIVVNKIFTNSSIYTASKAGLLAYTDVLREEVRKYNIKIINIVPGATRTPIWPSEILNSSANRMMSPEDIAKFLYEIYSLGNLNVVPEEIRLRPIEGDL